MIKYFLPAPVALICLMVLSFLVLIAALAVSRLWNNYWGLFSESLFVERVINCA
jgi:hypothetical protein